MNTILIYGNNKISAFLHTAFGESGLLTIDITQKINSLEDPQDIYAVLDVSNADNFIDEASDLIHNTAEIKELIDLANKVKAPYIFLYREREETHPESTIVTAMDLIKTYGERKSVKYATVQVEDIYGSDINTSKKLEEFISGITAGSNVLTVDSDENEHYLMHQKDFTTGLKEIIKVLNDPSSKSKHYTLYPEDPITEIELAHFLKDITDFDIEIVYSHDDRPTSFVLPNAETSYPETFYPDVPLKTGLELLCQESDIPLVENAETEIDSENAKLTEDDRFVDTSGLSIDPDEPIVDKVNDYDYDEEENRKSEDTFEEDKVEDGDDYDYSDYIDSTPVPTTKTSAPAKRKSRKAVAGLVGLLLVALSLPSFVFAYNLGSGIFYLNKSTGNIQNVDLNSAYTNSNKATFFFNKAANIPVPLSLIAKVMGISAKDQHLAIDTTKEIAQAINYISGVDLSAAFNNLGSSDLALNPDSNVLGASTQSGSEYIDKSLEKIDEVENSFDNLETRNKYVRDLMNRNINSLNENKDKLSKIKAIEPALRELLGYKTPQTYLLLLENLNISRSTGGEVEAFGILNVENGKISLSKLQTSKSVHDQIDLNAKIKAPDAIRSITNQETLHMEDVTWEPDFKNASKAAMSLYSSVGDENLDGVISIDTSVLKNFIEKIGEIRIGDRVVNKDNFSATLAENPNPDLIKDTFNYIFETFKNDPESFKVVEPILFSALNSRNMMVFHKEESTYSNIIQNNWGGGLKGGDSDEFLYFANNNLTDIPSGQITSEILYHGVLPTGDQGLSRTIEIKYTNNGDSDYLDHLMSLVPADTLLNTAKIDSAGGEKNITRTVKSSQYGARALYEMDLYIPSKQTVNLKIEYGSPQKAYKDQHIKISLQKQPGSGSIPFNIKLIGNTNSTSTIALDSDKDLKFPL